MVSIVISIKYAISCNHGLFQAIVHPISFISLTPSVDEFQVNGHIASWRDGRSCDLIALTQGM